jgi:DNA-binding transcriptional MerR regulator
MTQTHERPAATARTAADRSTAGPAGKVNGVNRLDDEDYPAYSMGRAAEIVGVTPAFLRALGAAKLIEPLRSEGGHRRFSRYQLRLAQRARELVDTGTGLEAACRIIILEDQLAEAQRINAALQRTAGPQHETTHRRDNAVQHDNP